MQLKQWELHWEAIFLFKPKKKGEMKEREIGGRFFTLESWQALVYKEDVAVSKACGLGRPD